MIILGCERHKYVPKYEINVFVGSLVISQHIGNVKIFVNSTIFIYSQAYYTELDSS